MIIAQFVLVIPIIATLARQGTEVLAQEYGDPLKSMNVRGLDAAVVFLWEGRHCLATAALAGFGRAIAEVGAVMIMGGNINHVTRVMTTSIALESSRGNLELALALGLLLLLLALMVNAAVGVLGRHPAPR